MGFISGLLIGGAVMLFVGWNFLPQPIWIRDWFIRKGWIKTPTTPVVP